MLLDMPIIYFNIFNFEMINLFFNYFIIYLIDIASFINSIAKWLLPVISLFIAIYVFYKQYILGFKISYRSSSSHTYDGNKMTFFIYNESILLDKYIQCMYVVINDKFKFKIDFGTDLLKLNKLECTTYHHCYTNMHTNDDKFDDIDILFPEKMSVFIIDPLGKSKKINVKSKSKIKFKDLNKLENATLYTKKLGEKVISKDVKYEVKVLNKKTKEEKIILILDNGWMNDILYGDNTLPKEWVVSSEVLLNNLNLLRDKFGVSDKEVVFIINELK